MNPARREPLLWLQLLGLAALPLEALLLLMVLAGADPGPLPGFERVLAWALGALAPAVLFWRLPPDLWSLLLLQVPLRGRRPEQLRLSALQTALPLKVLAAAGAALLLPLVWLLDASAGLAWAWSPLSESPRLVVLLVSLPLLTLMLWHWHQLIQTLWLFTRPLALVEETLPLTQAQAAESRLNLGLPLLLLQPLAIEKPAPQVVRTPEPAPEPESAPEAEAVAVAEPESVPAAEASDETPAAAAIPEDSGESEPDASTVSASELSEPNDDDIPTLDEAPAPNTEEATIAEADDDFTEALVEANADSNDLVVEAGVAVAPEQAAEEHERTNLYP